jgi:hypothetical protein
MACIIRFEGGGFTAPTGQKFTVNVTLPPCGGLGFLHIIYAGGDPVSGALHPSRLRAGFRTSTSFMPPVPRDRPVCEPSDGGGARTRPLQRDKEGLRRKVALP